MLDLSNHFRMATLGGIVRAFRTEAGLSQDELARRAGVAQAVISRLEQDQTNDPGIQQMARIALVLGKRLEDFLPDEGWQAKKLAGMPGAAEARASRSLDLEDRFAAIEVRVDDLARMVRDLAQARAGSAEAAAAPKSLPRKRSGGKS